MPALPNSKEIKLDEGKRNIHSVSAICTKSYCSLIMAQYTFFNFLPIGSTGNIHKTLYDNYRNYLPLMTGSAGELVSITIGRTMILRRT